MKAHQRKLDRYALLEAMTEQQVRHGRRSAAPRILPMIVSSHGEFCPGIAQLQQWLAERYRERLRLEGEREDGEKEDDLLATFQCELRAALLVATAKGTAEMMASAGRPYRKDGAQRSDFWLGTRAPGACAAEGTADEAINDDSSSSDSNTHSDSASDNDAVSGSRSPPSQVVETGAHGSNAIPEGAALASAVSDGSNSTSTSIDMHTGTNVELV